MFDEGAELVLVPVHGGGAVAEERREVEGREREGDVLCRLGGRLVRGRGRVSGQGQGQGQGSGVGVWLEFGLGFGLGRHLLSALGCAAEAQQVDHEQRR